MNRLKLYFNTVGCRLSDLEVKREKEGSEFESPVRDRWCALLRSLMLERNGSPMLQWLSSLDRFSQILILIIINILIPLIPCFFNIFIHFYIIIVEWTVHVYFEYKLEWSWWNSTSQSKLKWWTIMIYIFQVFLYMNHLQTTQQYTLIYSNWLIFLFYLWWWGSGIGEEDEVVVELGWKEAQRD